MKSYLIFISCLNCFNFFGQSTKISDLLYVLPRDLDYCDTWALKNGFQSVSNENYKDENCEYFFRYELITNTTIDLAFYKCIYDGFLPNVAIRTRLEKEYIGYKDEAKVLGFIYIETISSENGKLIFYNLLKDGVEYELCISTTNCVGFNVYEVALTKMNKSLELK